MGRRKMKEAHPPKMALEEISVNCTRNPWINTLTKSNRLRMLQSSIFLAIEITTPWISLSPFDKDLFCPTMVYCVGRALQTTPRALFLSPLPFWVPCRHSCGPLSPRSLCFPASPHFASRFAKQSARSESSLAPSIRCLMGFGRSEK